MPAAPAHLLEAPKDDAKVQAKFWNRQTSSFQQTYQPSSLQKRKHQINSLAHAAIANAGELAARQASSRKSKGDTAAKYGWERPLGVNGWRLHPRPRHKH
mmetsp:Transcript_24785/g.59863  ORF Transcript_24785/g.59863 Transcript_24785/m.59863 type:complete len:100 (-) Transcript_24785:188-487(-)